MVNLFEYVRYFLKRNSWEVTYASLSAKISGVCQLHLAPEIEELTKFFPVASAAALKFISSI